MLELIDVAKHYNGAIALAPTRLRVPRGETTVLIGPSGCGKSTLLRIVVGLVAPDSGRVVFDGETLGPANVRRLRARMGYVIQEGGLFPHMTVRANVTLMARQLGWDRARIETRLETLLALVHFPPALLDRYPLELSGGERQRVLLARALAQQPQLLLVDEPTNHLDIHAQLATLAALRALADTGMAVLAALHDLTLTARFADRVIMLDHGRVVASGPTLDVLTPERLGAIYHVRADIVPHPVDGTPLIAFAPSIDGSVHATARSAGSAG